MCAGGGKIRVSHRPVDGRPNAEVFMTRQRSKTRELAAGELAHATGGREPEPVPWIPIDRPILVEPPRPIEWGPIIVIDRRPPPLPWEPWLP
jgi:hypothetical protein